MCMVSSVRLSNWQLFRSAGECPRFCWRAGRHRSIQQPCLLWRAALLLPGQHPRYRVLGDLFVVIEFLLVLRRGNDQHELISSFFCFPDHGIPARVVKRRPAFEIGFGLCKVGKLVIIADAEPKCSFGVGMVCAWAKANSQVKVAKSRIVSVTCFLVCCGR